jgi:hypothetical protein
MSWDRVNERVIERRCEEGAAGTVCLRLLCCCWVLGYLSLMLTGRERVSECCIANGLFNNSAIIGRKEERSY